MTMKLRSQPGEQPVDVIETLFACHDRMRRAARHAERLATDVGVPEREVQEGAASLVAYFRVALPQHQADEDLSIRPRLHELDVPLETREALAQMSEQHVRFERDLEDVLPLWEALARDGSRLAAMPSWFVTVTTRLREELEAHLALEEETIYPAVRHYLSADSEAAILREMRGRRWQCESELRLLQPDARL